MGCGLFKMASGHFRLLLGLCEETLPCKEVTVLLVLLPVDVKSDKQSGLAPGKLCSVVGSSVLSSPVTLDSEAVLAG